ncbi:MAG: hypothetical protein M3Y33_08340 [Actinomycetota bacterium]|nr:hypothetical protein [Actinomycetota bacterium]
MSNEITALITALNSDELSLDQVAQKFRERSWPATTPPAPVTQAEWEARLMADPDPYVAGSFDDVAAAFFRGDITLDQYSVLSEAAAASINAEKKRQDAETAGLE